MSQQLETKSNRVAEYEHKVEHLSQDLSTKEASLVQTKQVSTMSAHTPVSVHVQWSV